MLVELVFVADTRSRRTTQPDDPNFVVWLSFDPFDLVTSSPECVRDFKRRERMAGRLPHIPQKSCLLLIVEIRVRNRGR
jgi:hypothetical protein